MGVLLNSLLMPDKRAVLFAIKGVIAMALSLYIAMFLNLDRPYWALVSAVFLQIRPEGGLVIEKGLCQIVGTLIGVSSGLPFSTGLHRIRKLPCLCLRCGWVLTPVWAPWCVVLTSFTPLRWRVLPPV